MYSFLNIEICVLQNGMFYRVISLKDATLYSTESNVPFQDPFNLFPVFKTFRRFHTRYHSNIASLLYLMDLHVGLNGMSKERWIE